MRQPPGGPRCAGNASGRRRGRRPGGPVRAIDLALHGVARCCWTRTTKSPRAAAPSASPSARSRSWTGWASGNARWTRAWSGTSARCSSAIASCTNSTCCPSRATSVPPSSTCSSTTWRQFLVDRLLRTRPVEICAGATESSRWRRAGVTSRVTVEHADGDYQARLRLPDRGRRLAQRHPRDARTRGAGARCSATAS